MKGYKVSYIIVLVLFYIGLSFYVFQGNSDGYFLAYAIISCPIIYSVTILLKDWRNE
jgi:hypothetical protein